MKPTPPSLITPRNPGTSRLAIRFIILSAAVYAVAGSVALALIRLAPPAPGAGAVFPPAFWLTTALLAGGSGALHRAAWCVRFEKQKRFRRNLVIALAAGTLFVGVQSYGLDWLLHKQDPDDVQTGASAFVTIFAVLHAMHFSLALLFLVWVALNSLADRYDHEYYWPVSVCAWFWHGLGIAWIAILCVFAISSL